MENVVTVKCEPDWPDDTEPELESIEEPQHALEEDSKAVTEVWVKPEPDSEDLISEDLIGLESNNEDQNCSAGNMEASAMEANENSEMKRKLADCQLPRESSSSDSSQRPRRSHLEKPFEESDIEDLEYEDIEDPNLLASSTSSPASSETSTDSHSESDSEQTKTQSGKSDCIWGDITRNDLGFTVFPGEAKVQLQIEAGQPIDIYSQFLDDKLLEMMVQETNRYAIQFKQNRNEERKSRNLKWKETNIEEMKKFLGIIICMGLVPHPTIHSYWSKNDLYDVQLIRQVMPRDRFLLLLRFWHFADNEANRQPGDHLYRIQPLLEKLNKSFENSLTVGKEMVIDETWSGRLVFKMCIPNKPHRYGMKLYKLCTREGYTVRTKIYAGKSSASESGVGHAHSVVMELLSGFLNEGRILYADDFYTSIPLAEELLRNETFLCGTLRSNRRGLPSIVKQKMKKGEVVGKMCQHGTRVIRWVDKRPVLMLSTLPSHSDCLVDSGKKNRDSEPLRKPLSILDYNRTKKGVDISNQMSSYYLGLWKRLKWYRKVALEVVIRTALVNAWILHTMLSARKMPLLKFQEKVARSLVGPQLEPVNSPRKRRAHTLSKMEGPARKVRRRCVVCYRAHRESSTSKDADKKTKQASRGSAEIKEDKLNPDLFNEVHIHSHTDHLNCSCGKPIIRTNSVSPPPPKSKKRFQCDMCSKTFGRRGHLKSHLLSHTGEKNFRCDVCFKFFSKKEHLNRHSIIHTGEKKYTCSLCPKQFGQRGTLNRHMLTHTGQKDFKCSTCGKEFVQRDHLNRHLVIHSGEKKYECPVCGKQFALRCNVKQHLISHTKEKKFSCSICGKPFAFKSVLKKHEATHVRGREFKCSVCSKDFELLSSLKRHEATHTIVVGMPTLPIVYRGTPANLAKQSNTPLAVGQDASTNQQITSKRKEILKINDVEEVTVDPDIPEHGLSSSDNEETSSKEDILDEKYPSSDTC